MTSQADTGVAESVTAPVETIHSRDEQVAFAIMVALLLIAPLFIYPFFMMQALCFALFACAFNLLVGYVGLLSFGHAMFLGFAGYVAAHIAKVGTVVLPPLTLFGVTAFPGFTANLGPQSPEVAILLGVASAAVLGLVTGALAIRRQGIYFSMITLALSQMIFFFCLQAPFTHGEDGIQGVPQGKLFGLFDLSYSRVFNTGIPSISWSPLGLGAPLVVNIQPYLYGLVFCVFILGFFAIHRIINSPFGEVLKAIRENEPRAISLGYKTDQYKLAAFVLSAMLVGLAGATKSIVAQNASLTDVDWKMSGEVVLMALIGGLGTVYGPVVGAFAIIFMQNYLAPFGQWVQVIQGTIFVTCVLAFRRGIVGEIAFLLKKSL